MGAIINTILLTTKKFIRSFNRKNKNVKLTQDAASIRLTENGEMRVTND